MAEHILLSNEGTLQAWCQHGHLHRAALPAGTSAQTTNLKNLPLTRSKFSNQSSSSWYRL